MVVQRVVSSLDRWGDREDSGSSLLWRDCQLVPKYCHGGDGTFEFLENAYAQRPSCSACHMSVGHTASPPVGRRQLEVWTAAVLNTRLISWLLTHVQIKRKDERTVDTRGWPR